MKMATDVVNMLEEYKQVKQTAIERLKLEGIQVVDEPSCVPLSALGISLGITDVVVCLAEYWGMNVDRAGLAADVVRVGRYWSHCYNALMVTVLQVQGEGEVVHTVWWTGKEDCRGRGKARAD